MKNFILILALLVTQNSFAQIDRKGNGGDAVICMKNYKLNAELLDVFEARVLHKTEYNYPTGTWSTDPNNTTVAKANAHGLVMRLEAFSPLLAKRYHDYINSFFEETNFVESVELPDIPDSNGVIIPTDCKIAQLVVQISDGSYGKTRYIINKDIWSLLDESNKAATVLHEVIYRAAIEEGQTDSRWTRYFNAIIFSDIIATLTPEQFSEIKNRAFTSRFTHKGIELGGVRTPSQKYYKIISAPSGMTSGLVLDDGLYNMTTNSIIEAHFNTTHRPVLGFEFPQGLSIGFSEKGVPTEIYAREIKGNQAGIKITPPDQASCIKSSPDFSGNHCTTLKLTITPKSDEVLVEGFSDVSTSKTKLQVSFKNNFLMTKNLDVPVQFSANMTKEQILVQVCGTSIKCKGIYVGFPNGGFATWQGNPPDLYPLLDIELRINGDYLESYYGSLKTVFEYNIPNTYVGNPDDLDTMINVNTIEFNQDGSYKFLQNVLKEQLKVVLKDGSSATLKRSGLYYFSCDKDGYLIAVPERALLD